MELAKPLVTLLASLTGKTDVNALYDFQLEQFGITRLPGGSVSDSICTLRSLGLTRGTDHAFYDLTTEGTNRLKTGWQTYDNVYYFSYSCDKSYRAGGAYMPDVDMLFLLIPFSMTMGSYRDAGEVILNVDGTVYGSVDGSWMPNDGMVNTVSERYPFGTAHKTYNVNAIESGLWNVHPDADEDHFSIIGSFIGPRPVTTRALFDGILSDIRRTKPIFDESRVNVGTQANKLAAPRSLSGRATVLKKASLAWKSVGPGCYYEVYRSNAENGEYTRIDTTLLTVYTDLTVSARRTYWYKIVAVPLTSGAVSSEFSQAVSVKL